MIEDGGDLAFLILLCRDELIVVPFNLYQPVQYLRILLPRTSMKPANSGGLLLLAGSNYQHSDDMDRC